MKNLFYSPSENILFWIAPYLSVRDKVHTKITDMTERCFDFSSAIRVRFNQVKVRTISDSRRFKDRELYWVEDQTIKIDIGKDIFIHNEKEVFNIGTGWTMAKWIES